MSPSKLERAINGNKTPTSAPHDGPVLREKRCEEQTRALQRVAQLEDERSIRDLLLGEANVSLNTSAEEIPDSSDSDSDTDSDSSVGTMDEEKLEKKLKKAKKAKKKAQKKVKKAKKANAANKRKAMTDVEGKTPKRAKVNYGLDPE
ncbi:hypothetical protein AX14_001915 [Amanita brunnescens Koide BX004]|nr:hypothetical protein AX14_001915 [Amanita brunnescens Koide BX004]